MPWLKKEGSPLFGYIRPHKPELLVKEFEQYRGVYCGLCRQLGKRYGWFARMTLSFDATFFALVLLGLGGGCCGFERKRCVVNPLKKCGFCAGGTEELQAAATLSVCMTYYKLRDDLDDGGIGKKARALLLLPFAARARKKACRIDPTMEGMVARMLEEQRQAEQEKDPGLDRCAEPTARMLSEVFPHAAAALGLDASPQSALFRLTRQFGYFLGRWVYLMDAADDMEDDAKKGCFNPYNKRLGLDKNAGPERFEEARTQANQALNLTLSQVAAAMELMEFRQFGSIIRNIIHLGLPQMQKEKLFAKEKKNVRSL